MNELPKMPIRAAVDAVATWNPARDAPDQEFTYIDLGSIDNELKAVCRSTRVMGADAPSRARQLLKSQDVLVSTVRPNLNGVARIPAHFDSATASTGFTVLRPRDGALDSTYLFHWVRTEEFISDMVRKATGASYPAVSDRIVRDSAIPLPEISEQRRIAAILDQADALRVRRRAAIARLDELAQSTFVEMFEFQKLDCSDVPMLSDVLVAIESGHSPVCLDRPALSSEWGVLKLGAVTRCEFDEGQNKALPAAEAPRTQHEVSAGDLLFTRKNTRDLVGAVAYVKQTRDRLLLPDLIFRLRLRPDSGVSPIYMHRALIQPKKRSEIQGLAGGSAGSMPNISKAKLAAVRFRRPPLALQKEFEQRVDAIDALKAVHRAALLELESLFSSLQHRAFRGEL
jgi:type I restriction enzyme S subunit